MIFAATAKESEVTMKAHIRNDSMDITKIIWELCVLVTLHESNGYGEKRLIDFEKNLAEVEKSFMSNACATSVNMKRGKVADVDTAVIQLIRRLKGVDWQKVLDVDELVIGGRDIVKIVNKLNEGK